ncbi:MAG: D-alanine--D-alanine ligase [Planctomycetes bacterium]|nr:D-alanine--D-alanine ligase [Planctomycetota bacterium]
MARIVLLHGIVPDDAPRDEQDTRVQAEAIARALARLGHEPARLDFTFDLARVSAALRAIAPAIVFNLVESVDGEGRFVHLAPAALERLGIPFTGAGMDAMFQTSNKLVAKRVLRAAGIPTPPWISEVEAEAEAAGAGPLILKSVWEHASVGLDEGALIDGADPRRARTELLRRRADFGGACFAERYIEGREFNLAVLAGPDGPESLPPAEMRFVDYPPGKPRIVDYRAKWDEASFEYRHTVRSYEFPGPDAPLLARLSAIARSCWHLFGLRGYARVDFRVDSAGEPWVLEVNANPCLSPDAGFAAAADRARIPYDRVVRRILEDVPGGSRA